MIYTTFGHEKGIGLETFLKSYSCLSHQEQRLFTLITNRIVLENYLNDYQIKYSINQNLLSIWGINLNLFFIENFDGSHSQASFSKAIELCSNKCVLLTLPTSKDVLEHNRGHTEYLRNLYKDNHISMNFINPNEQILLLTDHIPLSEVSNINIRNIVDQIQSSLEGYNRFLKREISDVVIAGINPHAGENGRIGDQDHVVALAINELKAKYKSITFIGPVSGDTLHTYDDQTTLKVFTYHDQGLAYFKGRYGLYGVNISFGLPFLRLSVDHGTAFNLYGKNIANYSGSKLTLETAISVQKREANEY